MKKIILLILIIQNSYSQNKEEDSIVINIIEGFRKFELQNLKEKIDCYTPNNEAGKLLKKTFIWKYYNITNGIVNNFPTYAINKTKKDTTLHSAMILLYYGDYLKEKGIYDTIAYENYSKSNIYGKKLESNLIMCEALKRMVVSVNSTQKNYNLLETLSKEYIHYAYDPYEKDLSRLLRIRAHSFIDKLPYISELKEGAAIAKANNNRLILAYYYKLLGVKHEVYSDYLEKNNLSLNNYRKSIEYYDKSLTVYSDCVPYYFVLNKKPGILLNKGINYLFQQKLDSAKINLTLSKMLITETDTENLILFHKWYALYHKLIKNLDSAYYHKDKEMQLRRSNYKNKIELSIAEIETKYQTTEKEKKIVQLLNTNLKTEAKRVKNRNFLIGSLILLFFGGITTFLINKNTKRKQRIAEQEREIEFQKTEKLLKDQELTAIDAMIAGQEKERQRIANDLHDNLGSTLATVKLHFNHLKNNREDSKTENKEELFIKTNDLLDEAYQKVRTIAHEKNSGVMAHQGLLPAIKKLTKNASSKDGLSIEVQDYGLEERLDNRLEISIFRMIQELVANAIKHSEASEINISLTNHDSLLNIIIEDNGKGFDAKILPQKDGMGLATIEKRVEHLEGTFEIDSTVNKGTNIIINIPI